MKRKGYLFEKIISINNLYNANLNAQKGKSKRRDIIEWNKDLFYNILKLHDDLKNDNYVVSDYFTFIIREPKERIISRLPFRDRVVHHAIMIHLESILKKSFISNTYSCIKGRGILKCSMDLRKALKSKPDYTLKLDISKFYPSIDHDILKQILRRKFKDPNLLKLLDIIINSKQGLPLGNFSSQWLANMYLNKFDHWIKETKRIKNYFRYCDDLVILGNNKAELHSLRREIQNYLSSNLKLQLSNYQIFKIESRGIDFVGYVHYYDHIRLRKSIKKRFIKMIKRNKNPKSIASYIGWLKWCNSRNLWNKYMKYEKISDIREESERIQ